ncbi:MAG TPA: YciI family protein [Candidatus Kapabacteria bacterium]|nr:YciI family protein [Candidatus Kapabacteria bacterium]
MKYMFLIYSNQAEEARWTDEQRQKMWTDFGAFTVDARERGAYVSGSALHPVTVATTVRVRDGRALKTDGPFAETKEQLGGYYILDCRDLDDALEFAARIPSSAHGSVEVRPLMQAGA